MSCVPCRDVSYNEKHPIVTLDQEQKEELLYEVFDEYGDKPIPE
jgi:hypothetical protein